jgi:ATP-binding cassette, subfamily B, multidrug efflux pump
MKPLDHLKPYFRERRWYVVAGVVCLMVVDFLQLLIPRIIKWSVDDLTLLRMDAATLLRYAVYMVGIALFIGGFRFLWRYCLIGLSRRVEEGLRNQLFSHIQTLSAAYFNRVKTGDLMAHATNDIQHVRMAIGMGIVALTDAIVLGTAAIGFMAYINLRLALYVLIPMPLIVFGTRFFSKRMHRQYGEVQATFAELTEVARERFAGIRIIKAYTREEAETAFFDGKSKDYVRKAMRLARITGSFFPMMLLLTNMSLAMVLYFGGRQTIRLTITPGDFVAFISYLGLLTWPMMAMGWVTNLIQRGRASLDRIHTILETLPEVKEPEFPVTLPTKQERGILSFENVSFSYASDLPLVLKTVQLSIFSGETVGIVGPPGSGKTSLLSLVPRIYDVGSGSILLDGHDIRQFALAHLRERIAFVSQEPFLFAGTIRDNITFGDPAVTEARLVEAAERASVLTTISEFPRGFDTLVGEKGVILSGGQKQRIALARAFLKDSRILILDDPISQVDVETGANIVRTLHDIQGTRTILIVSHRLSAVRFADKIIFLSGGCVAASGSHTDLMGSSDYYASTYRLQEMEEAYHAR